MENKHTGFFYCKTQKKMIKEFILKFTQENIIEEDLVRYENNYFLFDERFKVLKLKPIYAGIFVGRIKGNDVIPSLWLLQKLAEKSSKKVVVNEKGEWMFICSRDVFKENIIKIDNVKKEEYCLVVNQYNECLGYGIFEDNKIRRIFDIGDFLRRERKK